MYKQFGLAGHNGLDLAPVKPGTQGVVVRAPHDGYATLATERNANGSFYGYGNYVSLLGMPHDKDGSQHRSDLAHFSSFLVKDGQFVHMGDPVGIMGMTGFADGIHCHWTYKKVQNGVVLNQNNGYKGAIDVSLYTLIPTSRTLR